MDRCPPSHSRSRHLEPPGSVPRLGHDQSSHPLAPKSTYLLYGWTKDNSWSSRSVSFDLTDLDRLSPGTVRYDDISADGDESPITVPLAEFKATACKDR